MDDAINKYVKVLGVLNYGIYKKSVNRAYSSVFKMFALNNWGSMTQACRKLGITDFDGWRYSTGKNTPSIEKATRIFQAMPGMVEDLNKKIKKIEKEKIKMRDILLYFAIKYKGNWNKIYEALERKERVELSELEGLKLPGGGSPKYVTILDKDYPKALKAIYQPPFILFYQGELDIANKSCLTVVGSSIDSTEKLDKKLHGVLSRLDKDVAMVISGRSESERFALEDMSTHSRIVIKASGIQKDDDVFNKRDVLVLSEYPSTVNNYSKETIKTSNRLLAGLSSMILVTDSEKEDDVMNVVSHGLNQGKDIGAFTISPGGNSLIKQGAALIDSIQDIHDEYNIDQKTNSDEEEM